MNRDDLGRRLLSMFIIELEEQTQTMSTDVLALENAPDDSELLKRLFRGAHTLKGAAHTAGVPLVEQACHTLESKLSDVRAGHSRFSPADIAGLLQAVDALADAGRRLRDQESLDDSQLAELVAAAVGGRRSRGTRVRAGAPAAPAAPPGTGTPVTSDSLPESGSAHVRIDPRKFDALLASAGEVVTTSHRMATGRETASALLEVIARMRARQSSQGGRAEADAAVAGLLPELLTLSSRLATQAVDLGRDLTQVAENLSASTRALRMRPFSDACDGLARAVRDLAAAIHKEARFELVAGAAVEVDRAVLDRLRIALTHLVRNAVAHGIEAADVRARRGKPRAGMVRVSAEAVGDTLIVKVNDDGAGLDYRALRARFGSAEPADDEALARMLFEPGTSTRQQVSELAGRGVGLDAARAAVEAVRGSMRVESTAGVGATFVIEVPLTISLLRVVIAEVAGELVALPARAIAILVRVPVEDVVRLDGRHVLRTAHGPVTLVALAPLLGLPSNGEPVRDFVNAAVLQLADNRLAIGVDRLVIETEVLMRPLKRVHPPLPLILGAAIHGDGQPVLVLDSQALITAGLASPAAVLPLARSDDEIHAHRILVADDSLTTRTLLQGVLHGAGYDVVTAADGSAAWTLLRQEHFDLLVSDVEMPGMNGFELCAEVRRSPELAQLPIVLVTALETAEQQRRGLEAGADAYFVKTGFDQQELIERVQQLLA